MVDPPGEPTTKNNSPLGVSIILGDMELSIRFLQRISAPTSLVRLENCGHYPIEEPGLGQLREAMLTVRGQVAAQAG